MVSKIKVSNTTDIENINALEHDIVVINTYFETSEINIPYKDNQDFPYISNLVEQLHKNINQNSLIFVYGITQELIYYALELNKYFTFKYWNILDVIRDFQDEDLPHNHIGLLLFSVGKNLSLLNPKEERVNYRACIECDKNVKDWGGKKHLMNKKGTALSDVWLDFNKIITNIPDPQVENIQLTKVDSEELEFSITDHIIPEKILQRIRNISSSNHLNIEIGKNLRKPLPYPVPTENRDNKNMTAPGSEFVDKIFHADSITFLKEVIEKYPDGYFDVVFADPPYNLTKNYKDHDDGMTEDDYKNWCNEWLMLCAKALKPNGSLFVLNIPKWGIYHAEELNKHLYLKNWIVWDALSTPMGKIMPAHYSLLYYVKDPQSYTFNMQESTENKNLCLRTKCIKNREIVKHKIGDIWSDIHRIKHRKDRDDHPCQLPLKLMERIILMSSNENDIIFDPFCGAGTTPIVAKQLNRRYCATDISEFYVNIAEEGLRKVDENGFLVRDSVKIEKKSNLTKKAIELKVQEISKQLNRKITIDDLINMSSYKEEDILALYGDLKKPLKAASKVV